MKHLSPSSDVVVLLRKREVKRRLWASAAFDSRLSLWCPTLAVAPNVSRYTLKHTYTPGIIRVELKATCHRPTYV